MVHDTILYHYICGSDSDYFCLESCYNLKTAYLQAYLFLVVINWFDGIVIDRLWVGHSKIWHIDGMEGIPYVKPWKTVLIKRGVATVLYLVVALVVAGIVELLGKI